MEKHMFRFLRYAIIIFPVLFLVFLLTNIKQYTNKNNINVAIHLTTQQTLPINPSTHQLQDTIDFKGAKNAAKQITNQHQWNKIIQEIATGNKSWISFLPNILPYTPFHLKNELDQAISQALLKEPQVTLRSLALTHLTIENTNAVCSIPTLTQIQKENLAKILQSIHNPFVIYQKKSCLQNLLKTTHQKQMKIS